MNNTGKNTLSILESMVDVSIVAMQKIADLQLTVVSTQIDNVMDQLKFLDIFIAHDHLSSAEPGLAGAYGARTVDIVRKATTNLTVSNSKPASQVYKRYASATAPKIKPARRKIRKKRIHN